VQPRRVDGVRHEPVGLDRRQRQPKLGAAGLAAHPHLRAAAVRAQSIARTRALKPSKASAGYRGPTL
jgi:hypothetical protein